VLFFIFKIYKDIIEINNIANVNKTYQCFININLKNRKRVRKPERHNDVFVIPVTDTKRRLLLVAFIDFNAVISISKVEFKEYSNSA
jgi:hypothetical protein